MGKSLIFFFIHVLIHENLGGFLISGATSVFIFFFLFGQKNRQLLGTNENTQN